MNLLCPKIWKIRHRKYISTTQTEEIHPFMFDLEDEVLTPTGISPKISLL